MSTTLNKSNRFAALLDDNDGGYRENNNNNNNSRRNEPSGTNGRNRQQNCRGNRNVRRNSNSSNDNNNNNHLWNQNSKGRSIYNNEQKYQNQQETTSRTSNTIKQPPIPLYPVNNNSYAKRLADKKEASIKKEVVIDKKWSYVSVKDSKNKIIVIRNNDVDVHVDYSIDSIIDSLNNRHRQRVNEYIQLWGDDEYKRIFLFPNYEYGYFDRLDEELVVEEELRNNNTYTSGTYSE